MIPLGTVKLVAAIAVLVATFLAGIRVESNHRDAQLLAQEQAFAQQYGDEVKRAAANAKALQGKKEENRVIFQTITEYVDQIVDRPIYTNVCLDDDGLLLANDALLGRAPVGGAVPKPDAPGGR